MGMEERAHINNLTSQLRILEKQQPMEPKPIRRKEIIKLRVEINELESQKNLSKRLMKPKTVSLRK